MTSNQKETKNLTKKAKIEDLRKEKIYFIPGLMTDSRLWKRVIPLLEDDFEIIHICIPKLKDFDEIIKIIYNIVLKRKRRVICIISLFISNVHTFLFLCKYRNVIKDVHTLKIPASGAVIYTSTT